MQGGGSESALGRISQTISSLSHHILELQHQSHFQTHCLKRLIKCDHDDPTATPDFPIVKVEANVFVLYRSNT